MNKTFCAMRRSARPQLQPRKRKRPSLPRQQGNIDNQTCRRLEPSSPFSKTMIQALFFDGKTIIPCEQRFQRLPPKSLLYSRSIVQCSCRQNPKNNMDKTRRPRVPIGSSIVLTPPDEAKRRGVYEECFSRVGIRQMLALCGSGYGVQGFRCFPWLGLNLHMACNLNLNPSTLQLVQNSGNLPMVAKPLYGVLSDALYIAGAHRIPYVSIGVLLQVLCWGSLGLIPLAGEALPTLMICVLLSNLGASIAEVANDALVAEYGQKNKMAGLQSYAFMASAAGGILGNLLGGFFLLKTHLPKPMFLAYAAMLSVQLLLSLATREESLGLHKSLNHYPSETSVWQCIRKQYSDLKTTVSDESIIRPLIWIVVSIAAVPILSGSMFCYQTQCLNLDPSVIGMSRVAGQLTLLSMTMLYNRFWKRIPLRKLIVILQILYAFSLLLDLVLVKQINLKLGIPNEKFALYFSAVAETIAQFKLLPFQVLFARLAPPGCEGSLMSFLASSLCLSSIFSGFLGVGLAYLLGITSGNYSSLPLGIVIQFLAALVPLGWTRNVPTSELSHEKEKMSSRSKRTRKTKRIGRVLPCPFYAYGRERESEARG